VRELRQLRDECLNGNEFVTLDGVTEILKAWRHAYTHCRPHGSLGNLTPRPRTLVLSNSKNGPTSILQRDRILAHHRALIFRPVGRPLGLVTIRRVTLCVFRYGGPTRATSVSPAFAGIWGGPLTAGEMQ